MCVLNFNDDDSLELVQQFYVPYVVLFDGCSLDNYEIPNLITPFFSPSHLHGDEKTNY